MDLRCSPEPTMVLKSNSLLKHSIEMDEKKLFKQRLSKALYTASYGNLTRQNISGFIGNYYRNGDAIFSEPRFWANPCKTNEYIQNKLMSIGQSLS